MTPASQNPGSTDSKALAFRQVDEFHNDFGFVLHKSRRMMPADSLTMHLTIHALERAVRGLLPFYGVDCSIAIYDGRKPESLVARATLGAIEGWNPPCPSLLLVVG
jgi:hypothetical protein